MFIRMREIKSTSHFLIVSTLVSISYKDPFPLSVSCTLNLCKFSYTYHSPIILHNHCTLPDNHGVCGSVLMSCLCLGFPQVDLTLTSYTLCYVLSSSCYFCVPRTYHTLSICLFMVALCCLMVLEIHFAFLVEWYFATPLYSILPVTGTRRREYSYLSTARQSLLHFQYSINCKSLQ